MVNFQSALNFVSISYKVSCSTFWKVLNGTIKKKKKKKTEWFVCPNAKQLGTLDIST